MSLQHHTTLNAGSTGAKRQSWKEVNPRSILIKLIADNPHETRQDEEHIIELLWQKIKGDETTLHNMCEYWGVNNYRSIVYKEDPRRQLQIDEAKKKIIQRIMLLDWTMPNGKRLRECTKSDCLRAGGWLVKVANKLKPRQKVGQVFSETQLRGMLPK